MGSQHGYELPPKDQEGLEVSLNPEELASGLSSEAIKRKFEGQSGGTETEGSKRSRLGAASKKETSTKKHKDFKF